MSNLFLRRPIFSAVCSLVIFIAGMVAIPTLPIAQYPAIAPPVVTITTAYIGASPQAVETAVTIPLEQAVNGDEGLRYISSQSSQGVSQITCTFSLGRDLDIAASDIQNAVQSALGRLPAEVKQTGITVGKNSGSFVMALGLISDSSKYDQEFLGNYAELNVVNDLKRVPGVSDVIIFGQRRYAMRVWLNPHELSSRGLATSDVLQSLQEQNVQVAAGSIGGPPEPENQPYTMTVNAVGRLTNPSEFENIIVRSEANGGFTKLGDVARIELGAEDYSSFVRFDGNDNVVGLGVLQLPTANALTVSNGVLTRLNALQKQFPPGVHYSIAFNSTEFVRESMKDVVITLLIAIALVILVIFLFLQDPRATLIPAATIPVSLIGTFFVMKLFGFTINTITLFGLTLATGLVVDDAIVVIENISRYAGEHNMYGIEGAAAAMREVRSAVVASSLVLLAVFIPVAFFPGTTGQVYKQFALTIAASITISLFCALTLAPALSSLLLRHPPNATTGLFGFFNRSLSRFRDWYRSLLPVLFRARWIVIALFVAALVLTGFLFRSTPTGFIPAEDQGYFITLIQAPEGTSLANERKIAIKTEKIIRAQPGVQDVFNVGGFSFSGNGSNRGVLFTLLKPWSERKSFTESVIGILYGPTGLMGKFQQQIPEAQVFAFNPPAINGVGTIGGFTFELEDRGNVGLPTLMKTAYGFMALGNQPGAATSQVFTQFRIDAPQLQVNVDRNKAKSIGVSLADLFGTMQADLGSVYVNDFDYLNRSYRVYVQADAPYRDRVSALQQLYVRSTQGGIVPVSALVSAKQVLAPPTITHYNLFRSIELSGNASPGYGTGQAIETMQDIAKKINPPGVGFEWSGLSLEEIEAGSQAAIIFLLGLVFVYLVLCAQYESFIDPLIVVLAVPAALHGALLFLNYRLAMGHAGIIGFILFGNPALSQDAYVQVGYVMLIGLASKSAILIVEFANQQIRAGADVVTAALRAAQTRLRPILMTSIAFIIAMAPLVVASGAGSGARQSLGTAVFGGMLISTFLNLVITPVLYVVIKSFELRGRRAGGANGEGHVSAIDTAPASEPVGR
ncbi:MAG: efflux RND transporter permease subunit [Candidatus Eremiobacteraeota bacterium]|nr:efflux RND transporter permease subunit [Candidatus Eremiobacteraeota bacterium]